MGWKDLLAFLQNQVPLGTVTTYGNLASVFFGGPNAAQAIVAMLNGAVNDDPANSIWTNRVVNAHGAINVPGQLEQLQSEGVAIGTNGKVDFNISPPLDFEEQESVYPAPPPPRPPAPSTGTSSLDIFKNLIDQQGCRGIDDLKEILRSTPYEKSSFANLIHNKLEGRLKAFFNGQGEDLFTLIQLAGNHNQLPNNAIDLAHLIRKVRNQIIHHDVPVESFHARNCLVVSAACLLWPQLSG